MSLGLARDFLQGVGCRLKETPKAKNKRAPVSSICPSCARIPRHRGSDLFLSEKETLVNGPTHGRSLRMVRLSILARRDSTLRLDLVCRDSICGSCDMLVNGTPKLLCKYSPKTCRKTPHSCHYATGWCESPLECAHEHQEIRL